MTNKRELILQSCLNLVMEKGSYDISVQSIASEANIGKGTIYEYFSSKEELLISTLEYYLSHRFMEQIKIERFEELSFEEVFKTQLFKIFDNAIRNNAFIQIFLSTNVFNLNLQDKQKLVSLMQNIRNHFTLIFTEMFKKAIEEDLIKKCPSNEDITLVKSIITGSVTELKNEICMDLEVDELINIKKYIDRVYEVVLVILN